MKNYLFIIILFTAYHLKAQIKVSRLIFPLPVAQEKFDLRANLFLSINYTDFQKIFINNKEEIGRLGDREAFLYALFQSVYQKKESEYIKTSTGSDDDINGSYAFYSNMAPRSKEPKLDFSFDAGMIRIYFIELSPDIPDLAIAIKKTANGYVNAPGTLDTPLAQAIMMLASNKKAFPDIYKPVSKTKTNVELRFDTATGPQGDNYVSLLFKGYKIKYDLTSIDTAQKQARAYKKVLSTYRDIYMTARKRDTGAYLGALTPQSSDRIREGLQKCSKTDIKQFFDYEKSFSKINYVMDIGDMYILFFDFGKYKVGDTPAIKFMSQSKNMKEMNVNNQFYLQQIFATAEFQAILSK